MSSVILDKFSSGAVGGGAFDGISTFTYADLVTARADSINRVNGQYADIPSGMCKLVSGVWVPAYVADNGTCIVENVIKGDVVPSLEDIPWVEGGTGGVITSDGTKVTMNTPLVADTVLTQYL
jgi:hypothetical protein